MLSPAGWSNARGSSSKMEPKPLTVTTSDVSPEPRCSVLPMLTPHEM